MGAEPRGPRCGVSVLLLVESGGMGPRAGSLALRPRPPPRPGAAHMLRAALWPLGPKTEPAPLGHRSTPQPQAGGCSLGSSVPEEVSPATWRVCFSAWAGRAALPSASVSSLLWLQTVAKSIPRRGPSSWVETGSQTMGALGSYRTLIQHCSSARAGQQVWLL